MDERRRNAAALVCVPAVAAYNWWLFVPFDHGLLRSTNSFFSDLEVRGPRDATMFERLDVTAGVLFAIALTAESTAARRAQAGVAAVPRVRVRRRSRRSFPFSCAEGTSSACRSAEWHLQLPWYHYAHVLASAVEFLAISIGVLVAWHRTRNERSLEATLFRTIGIVLVVAYAPLAVSYFSDHLAALVEPLFFVAFSIAVVTEATHEPSTIWCFGVRHPHHVWVTHAISPSSARRVSRSGLRPRSRTGRGSPWHAAACPSSSRG